MEIDMKDLVFYKIKSLINSKLLITINDILKYYLNSECENLQELFPYVQALKKDEIDKTKNQLKKDKKNFLKIILIKCQLLKFLY